MRRFAFVLGLLMAGMFGCTVGPNYQPPKTQLPDHWAASAQTTTRPASQPSDTAESVFTTAPPDNLAQWWRTLSDPALDRLIERAIASNLTLRIAEARIREARAQRDIVAGGQYPGVQATAAYSRQQASANGQLGQAMRGPVSSLIGNELTKPTDLFQVGFDASWELDLFGGVRRSVEAADANTAGTVEQHRDALVSVIAEVARTYVTLRGIQRRLQIAEDNVAAQQATLELVRNKRSVGAVPELDVTRAAAQVALAQSQIPTLQRHIQRAILALSVLLKEEPDVLNGELGSPAAFPAKPAEVPIGLPADLLRRRPDIRQAERTLAASTAQIGVATADLFPRVALNGRFNLEATKFSDVWDWDSRTFGFGPAIRWTVFDAGRIRANIRVQNARQEQALARYEQVVLTAIREVEEALITYETEQTRRQHLADCVRFSAEAVELAEIAYEGGATDLLAVLDARRTFHVSEDALAEADQTVLTSLIALYKALGGGWDAVAEQPQ